MSNHRHALQIVAFAALVLAAWRGWLGWTGARADFGDSSYQANLIRLETYLARTTPPPVVLTGSSVTGRLLSRFFDGTAVPEVGNLGLDGSTALAGMEVIAAREPHPSVVLVETYLIGRPPGPNDAALVAALEGPGVRLALEDRLFRASSRPSALLYSALKARTGDGPGTPAVAPVREESAPAAGLAEPSQDSQELPERWRAAFRTLRERGIRVILLDLPLGREEWGVPAGVDWAAEEFGLERFDLRAALAAAGVEPRYTDGLHLDSASARAACRVLADWLAASPGR